MIMEEKKNIREIVKKFLDTHRPEACDDFGVHGWSHEFPESSAAELDVAELYQEEFEEFAKILQIEFANHVAFEDAMDWCRRYRGDWLDRVNLHEGLEDVDRFERGFSIF